MNFKMLCVFSFLALFITYGCASNVKNAEIEIVVSNSDGPKANFSITIYNWFYGDADSSGYLEPEIITTLTDGNGVVRVVLNESAFIQVDTSFQEDWDTLAERYINSKSTKIEVTIND